MARHGYTFAAPPFASIEFESLIDKLEQTEAFWRMERFVHRGLPGKRMWKIWCPSAAKEIHTQRSSCRGRVLIDS